MKYCMVMTTTSSEEEADKIMQKVLKNRLVSCVQQSSIKSSYHWKGKIESSSEVLLIMKTTEDLYKNLEEMIVKNHSYETPQVVCLPIVEGFEPYLTWIASETKR